MREALAPVAWPGQTPAALSLTFDVDGESSVLGDPQHNDPARLTSLSEGRFGLGTGLERVIAALKESDVRATFFIPGLVLDSAAEEVAAIIDGGHEIGHHGYHHLQPHLIDAELQRSEVDQGLEALARHSIIPKGYRSPAWQLTPVTRDLLHERGFLYDSSLMEDDRPYREVWGDGRSFMEFPPHWSLDDVPYFRYTVETGGNLSQPYYVLEIWKLELERAVAEGRHVVLTMHPEVIGRASRMVVLEGILAWARANGMWIAPLHSVAEVFADAEARS